MDDMGSTLLYIIGGVLYLLFSVKKSKNKPTQQRPSHRIPPKHPVLPESRPDEFNLPDFFPMPDAASEAPYETSDGTDVTATSMQPSEFEPVSMDTGQVLTAGPASAPWQTDAAPFLTSDLEALFRAPSMGSIPDACPPAAEPLQGAADTEKMPEVSDTEPSGILQDFDLRRAVIYSEILRPKF